MKKWQSNWDREEKGRHLYSIQQKVGRGKITGRNRMEEIIFTRLRIGHCGLNKCLHILGKHRSGRCEFCDRIESVEHVVLECQKYERERIKMKESIRNLGVQGNSLKELLGKNSNDVSTHLFSFLKDTGIVNRI